MAAGLIQLVAYGIEDMYLTGDPQITFFKVVYRRYTNFSIESVKQDFSEPADFGRSVTCTLSKSGDLVNEIFVCVQLPAIPKFIDIDTGLENKVKKFAWVKNLGFSLIQEVSVEIDGRIIDRQYGEWLYIWSQLSNTYKGLSKMIGNFKSVYNFSNGKSGYVLYIPLSFWFCKNTGMSLPLIALSSTDVKINVIFRKLEECVRIGPTHSVQVLDDVVPFKLGDYITQTINGLQINGYVIKFDYISKILYYIKINNNNAINKTFQSLQESTTSSGIVNNTTYKNNIPYRIYNRDGVYCTPTPNTIEFIENTILNVKPKIVNAYLYVNYVYLDRDERLKFAKTNHEYLIEQVQFNQELYVRSPNVKFSLTLNHPCKAHYWIAQLDSVVGAGTINDINNYTTSLFGDGKNLILSAQLLLNGQPRFSTRDSIYFNKQQPYDYYKCGPATGINMYSFCLNPADFQPSSSCNMTNVDNISMNIKLDESINTQNTCKIRSYTINYNVLRIAFNLGGLAFI